MRKDSLPYYTYYDEFKLNISIEDALERIYFIFSNYQKKIILGFITNFINEIGFDHSVENLKVVHMKYFKRDDKNIIHRRSVHLLAQVFFSFNNFSEENNNELTYVDVSILFLLANQILDITEGSDYSSDLRVLFNSYKFSNDLVNDHDVLCSFYFYAKFYKELTNSPNRDEFNKLLKEKLNITIIKYSQILEDRSSNKKTISKKFLKKLFTLNINLTFTKWQKREPIINIPFEYRMLETFPLIYYKKPLLKFFPLLFFKTETYCVCDPHFMMNSIAKKIYNTLSTIKFRSEFGIVAEKVIREYMEGNLVNSNCKFINLERKDLNGKKEYEYGDFGILIENMLFLFEIKAGILGLEKKYESNIDEFQKNFNSRYVDKKGVRQQIKILKEIDKNFELFCSTANINLNKKYQIIPVLLFLDDEFIAAGLNKYVGNEFRRILPEYEIKGKNIFLPENNSSLTLNELKLAIDRLKSPEKVLETIFKYNNNFHNRKISLLCYEEFLTEYYFKQNSV